ncbi:MAG: ribonuclease P protein component [Candidatus Staskawiczbacteria bacterium]|nr:ribonuclease P protein component [Candidatus Staskawiczbacteria bacterium]
MLPEKNRLRKKKDFEEIFKNSKSFKEGFLVLRARKNNFKTSRFGFIVSLKVSKKATVRNKVKRRLREAVKKYIEDGPYSKNKNKKSVDAILIALPGSEKIKFSDLKETVVKIFENV